MSDYKKNDGFSETCSAIMSRIVTAAITILVTVFPLIYHNAYRDIMDTKYICYCVIIIGMVCMILLLLLVMGGIDCIKYDKIHIKQLLNNLLPTNWKNIFCAADVAVLVFWLAAGISTLQSDYLFESFWGNEGRFSGFFLLTLYVCSYFLISRCWRIKGWCLQLFLTSGMIICVLGITDYFQMDVLNFRGGFQTEETRIFMSTVGNINVFTAYVGLVMGFSASMFAVEKNNWKLIWYYGCMIISFFAIIMGCSDNAYLGLAALFGLSPFVLFRNMEGVKRYLIMLASFLSVVLCISWINQRYYDVVLGLEALFRVISNFSGLPFLVIFLWLTAALVELLERKLHVNQEKFGKRMTVIWKVAVGIVVAVFCFVLYDANVTGHVERYRSLANYLVFNDTWGTARGYVWRVSMELYHDFPVIRKLFGYGPDTFGILTVSRIFKDMNDKTGFIYDNAHNEYLHYLITIGMIGAGAYLIFLISAFYSMKKRLSSPYVAGALGATVCYAAQAFVNLNLPIATPVLWLLLSIGMIGAKGGESVNNS